MTASPIQGRERTSIPMLLLAAGGILIAVTALFLGKITSVTAMLAAILAVSILAIRPRNELLRLFKLFLLATFCVLPAWQLAAGDEIYLNLLPQDSTVWCSASISPTGGRASRDSCIFLRWLPLRPSCSSM
jgi:hypothetical protein